jgi:7-carboxy-7-deazaguanine synthase
MKLLNSQAIEKFDASDNLDVHSVFATIQGEGPFVGMPAVFVRLAGCNLQCPLCDTDYTTDRRRVSPRELALEVDAKASPGIRLVVITGGEPFRQRLFELARILTSLSYLVQIETNGTLPAHSLEPLNVHIVVSPKSGRVNPSVWAQASSVKYVLSAGSIASDDGLPILALGHTAYPRVARPPEDWRGAIYVQPADDEHYDANLAAAISSAGRFGYRLSLQTHKLIGLP